MTKLTIPHRGSQLAQVLLFTVASLSFVEAAKENGPPLLDGPSSTVAFYGETKVVDTVLGEIRMWRKGPFLITYVAGKSGPSSISVARTDGAEMSRREAFAIGTRYCGKQDWLVLSKDADSEVFTNADRSLQLTYAMREENAGNRPHFSLTPTVGQAPEFPFMGFNDVVGPIRRFWPVILGGAFVLGLLGTQIGDGEFKDINLSEVIYKTLSALGGSALLSAMIFSFTESLSSKGVADGAKTVQVPGQFLITVFLVILLSFVFGGYFTPEPRLDPSDYPDGYVPYDRSDDY